MMNQTPRPSRPLPAMVRGEPLLEVPKSLYIPPEALRVMLDDFEGPMDLLLFLIRKHKFDILDIPMTALCRQYAAYVEDIVGQDLELAADYLAMSALLLEIKTKMLLPRPPAEDENEEDPRADLARRLLEYERLRQAATDIAALPRRQRDFISPRLMVDLPAVNLAPVLQSSLLAAAMTAVLLRQTLHVPYVYRRESVSLREIMSNILRRLVVGVRVEFRLLAEKHRGGVTFLALLILAAEQTISLSQANADGEIYVSTIGREEHDGTKH